MGMVGFFWVGISVNLSLGLCKVNFKASFRDSGYSFECIFANMKVIRGPIFEMAFG